MNSFVKWTFGVALSLAVSGQLKTATFKMAELALDAHRHQMSYGKFSRLLTTAAKNQKIHH